MLGAMQIVASRLVDQATQAAAGNRQMFDALYEIEKMREENRKGTAARRPKITSFASLMAQRGGPPRRK